MTHSEPEHRMSIVEAYMARLAVPPSVATPPRDLHHGDLDRSFFAGLDDLDSGLCDLPLTLTTDPTTCTHCGYPVCPICQRVHVAEFSEPCSPCQEAHPDQWEA